MDIDSKVLRRFLEGKEKEGDKDRVIEWFSSLDYERSLRDEYAGYWDEFSSDGIEDQFDEKGVLDSIYHKMVMEDALAQRKRGGMRRMLHFAQRVAAVLFIPLLAYMLLTMNNRLVQGETSFSEIYSPLGTRTKFFLPDGSQGWLNSGSTLRFPAEFSRKARKVELEGEAYFDVQPDPDRPFEVKLEDFQVVALGTSFNIRGYGDEQIVSVALVSGLVEIWKTKNGRLRKFGTMEPDQLCIHNPVRNYTRISNADLDAQVAWKSGILMFREESLKSVVNKLNRWYNVEIQIRDQALERYRYQATFQDETLDEVLKLLKLSAPIQYRELGRKEKMNGVMGKRRIEIY